jgi:hypothetical protein
MPGERLKKLKACLSSAFSTVVCGAAAILPYRARQVFVFLLHFLMNGVLVKLKLLGNLIITIFSYILFLPVYFAGIPFTLLLRKAASLKDGSDPFPTRREVKNDDIERMF